MRLIWRHAQDGMPHVGGRRANTVLANARWAPIRLVLGYLWGTFILFLFGALMPKVDDLKVLIVFVSLVHLAIYWGYKLGIYRYLTARIVARASVAGNQKIINFLLFVGSVHLFMVSIESINLVISGGGPTLVEAISNQGAAYASKDEAFRLGAENIGLKFQILNLTSGFSMLVVPLLIVYWQRNSKLARIAALCAIGTQLAFYALIGTQKGIGDFVVSVFFCMAVRRYLYGTYRSKVQQMRAKFYLLVGVFLGVVFLLYMADNLSGRIDVFGRDSELVSDTPSKSLAWLLGERMGYGMEIALAYPSHGYYGLALNLDTEFEWTYGLGAARALNAYKLQYLGGEDFYMRTYPARTELITGWPKDMYWSTIYPWLASDLTYPGTIVFMGVLGFFLAKLWSESILTASPVSLALLVQLGILFAYVPANNQLGISKTSVIGVVTLLAAYFALGLIDRHNRVSEQRSMRAVL